MILRTLARGRPFGLTVTMLKSRSMWPPGGWQFFQPATGWNAPEGLTFEQVVEAIIRHRMANKQHRLATDVDVVAQQLDDFTCARLKNHPSWCSTQTAPASFMQPLPTRSLRAGAKEGVAGGVKLFQNATTGIKTWIDWFGEGKPVERTLAEERASICIECPKNDQKKGVFAWFTGAAVREIKAIFSALNDLDMRTTKDDKLMVCMACDCPLRAKVWAPLHIIKKHLRKEAFDALDENCWIRHEPPQ
jgi:hypothetical protein